MSRFYDRVADLMYLTRSMPGRQVTRMENRRFAMQRVNRRHKPREVWRRPLKAGRLPLNVGPAPRRRRHEDIVIRAMEHGHDLLPAIMERMGVIVHVVDIGGN